MTIFILFFLLILFISIQVNRTPWVRTKKRLTPRQHKALKEFWPTTTPEEQHAINQYLSIGGRRPTTIIRELQSYR
jgi:hypothetical protein